MWRHASYVSSSALAHQALHDTSRACLWEMRKIYLQAALRSGIPGRRADAPGSQHARSNASHMPLESAGGDRCVFLQIRSLLRCLMLSTRQLPTCLTTVNHSQSTEWPESVLLAHLALLGEPLPALPAAE